MTTMHLAIEHGGHLSEFTEGSIKGSNNNRNVVFDKPTHPPKQSNRERLRLPNTHLHVIGMEALQGSGSCGSGQI